MFTFLNNSHTLRNTGTFYESKNFVNEHQEHASETESGTGKYARSKYEQWPVASISAPNFQSGTCDDNEDQDGDSVSSKPNRKAFLDSIHNGSPELSVFARRSNIKSKRNNSNQSWQTTAEGTLQQVATAAANEVGSNALRSSLVPTQNLWTSQETDLKSSAMLDKRLEFSQEQQRQRQQKQQQNHSQRDETATTIHHYSHAQPTFWPSKTATTSTQTQLNFSLNDYSTNSDNNNDNSLSATSDNWPTLRPPAMPQVTTQRGRTSASATRTVEETGTVLTAIRGRKSATPQHKLVDFGFNLNDDDDDNCCLLSTGDHLGRNEVVERNASDHVLSSAAPESGVTPVPPPRAICDSCNAAKLHVSIKLPMKVHKIIILKRPRLNYATTINQ